MTRFTPAIVFAALLSAAPFAFADEQAQEEPKPPWSGSAGLSWVSTSGNSDTSTLGAELTVKRQPTPWGIEIAANFMRAEQEGEETAERHPESGRADWALYQRGIALKAAGDPEAAIAAFRELQGRYPESLYSIRCQDLIRECQLARGEKPPPDSAVVERALGTCGAECLKLICDHHDLPATVEELARLSETKVEGATFAGLKKAAEAKGLQAKGMIGNLLYLAKAPKPCLVWVQGNHFACACCFDCVCEGFETFTGADNNSVTTVDVHCRDPERVVISDQPISSVHIHICYHCCVVERILSGVDDITQPTGCSGAARSPGGRSFINKN